MPVQTRPAADQALQDVYKRQVPAVLLLASQVLKLFGVEWDYTGLAEQLTAIVGTIFAILALLGVVNDPTTEGVGDSRQALTYETPKGK